MSVPAKYRHLGDFPAYYCGRKKAPIRTVFIGGNHEASSHLWELYYGGWVAPNIYYLGAANTLRYGPIRITGMSGIWKDVDYYKPHFERLPFNYGDIKGFCHVREIDVRKLLLIRDQVDIGLSHDWPNLIERYGDLEDLFERMPHFKRDSTAGTLGSIAAANVMDRLRPSYWFSAHMHCKFTATKTYPPPGTETATEVEDIVSKSTSAASTAIQGGGGPKTNAASSIEFDLNLDHMDNVNGRSPAGQSVLVTAPDDPKVAKARIKSETRQAQLRAFSAPPQKPIVLPVPPTITNTVTRFMALDKPLPGREFLEVIDILPASTPNQQPGTAFRLQYDPEWLAITRAFHTSLRIGKRGEPTPPDLGETIYRPVIDKARKWVEENIVQKNRLDIPENFSMSAPPHQPGGLENTNRQPDEYTNPQTAEFCRLLGIDNLWDAADEERAVRKAGRPPLDEPNDIRGTDSRADRSSRGSGRGGY